MLRNPTTLIPLINATMKAKCNILDLKKNKAASRQGYVYAQNASNISIDIKYISKLAILKLFRSLTFRMALVFFLNEHNFGKNKTR